MASRTVGTITLLSDIAGPCWAGDCRDSQNIFRCWQKIVSGAAPNKCTALNSLARGTSCTASNECAAGLVCDTAATKKCIAGVTSGNTCANTAQCATDLKCGLTNTASVCCSSVLSSSANVLNAISPTSTVCNELAIGASCKVNAQCKSELCTGNKCTAPLKTGASCTKHAQCASKKCPCGGWHSCPCKCT